MNNIEWYRSKLNNPSCHMTLIDMKQRGTFWYAMSVYFPHNKNYCNIDDYSDFSIHMKNKFGDFEMAINNNSYKFSHYQ